MNNDITTLLTEYCVPAERSPPYRLIGRDRHKKDTVIACAYSPKELREFLILSRIKSPLTRTIFHTVLVLEKEYNVK